MTEAYHAVPTMECSACRIDVPAGNFCGCCGCQGGRLKVLRPGTFGAESRESVLKPALASSLFPHLPHRSLTPFRITLGLAAAGLLLSAALRLPALGIAISALGLPVLFWLYLRATAADRDCPRSSLMLAAGLGGALGATWVLLSAEFVARTYGVPMTVGVALHHLVREGFLIPAVGIVLMAVPTVLVRLVRPGGRESLDGFVIGALTGLTFSATATLIRLAPQVQSGLIAHARPLRSLVVEVVLAGVTVPITAAAASGMLGIALWFRQREDLSGRQVRVRPTLVLLAVLALLLHAGAALVDIVGLADLVMLSVHLGATVFIVLLLRVSMQLALLNEANDPDAADQPLLCPNCERVVPDMGFCPACGAATRASSKLSRAQRRGEQRPRAADPAPIDVSGPPLRTYPGYATAAGSYTAPPLTGTRFAWLLGRWGTAIVCAAVLLGGAALVLTPKLARYTCPPDCGRPPTGTPVMALPRFTAPDGSFSVAYPAPGSAYTVTAEDNGITATYTGGDGGVMQLFSEPARGRSPRDVIRAIVARTFPDAEVDYEIPNAMVGYQRGYGEVADTWPQGSRAGYSRVRILIMAAVKNDLALVAFATGPYHAFGPDFGPGPPSGANLELALDMGKYVNSFQWRDDNPR